jgi:hypothetical protein
MSAATAIAAARSAGWKLGINGDKLVIEAPGDPEAAILDELREHKGGALALLRDERWAINRTIIENFKSSPPFTCAHCGDPISSGPRERPARVVIYCGADDRLDLHARCRPAWQAAQEAEAEAVTMIKGMKRSA